MNFLCVPVMKLTVLLFSLLFQIYVTTAWVSLPALCITDCFCKSIPTGVLFMFSWNLFCNFI